MSLEKREAEVRRGQEAERLFSSEIFQDSIRVLEKKILTDWKNTKPDEKDRREYLHTRYTALLSVVAELRKVMDTGTLASEQLAAPQGADVRSH